VRLNGDWSRQRPHCCCLTLKCWAKNTNRDICVARRSRRVHRRVKKV
jgi:hypothetical protein